MINLEDQIDDLFRDARENYPLKTGEGDWDRVLNELKKNGESIIPPIQTQGKFRRLFWLLLLLPIGWMIYTKFGGNTVSHKSNRLREGKSIAATNYFHKTNPMNNKIIVPGKSMIRLDKLAITNHAKQFENNNSTPSNNNVSSRYSDATATNSDLNPSQTLKEMVNHGEIEEPLAKNTTRDYSSTINTSLKSNTAQNLLPTIGTITSSLTNEINQNIVKASTSLSMDSSNASNKPLNKKTSKRKKGFYFGVLAGPDISTIKMQQVKKAGYSLGILAGYRLNKRFSLETNFLYDRKNYYTNGKYVNKQNLSIPSTDSVINLNGYCQMYEFDLTGRYDFAPFKKDHFFIRGGLASYFMKEQEYSYLGTWSNSIPYYQSINYGNTTNNLFSVIHISAGYEYKMGKVSIRIEPYLKIPTMGLGKGKLPVTSMSLYMGITVPLN